MSTLNPEIRWQWHDGNAMTGGNQSPKINEKDAPQQLDTTGLQCPLPVLRARKTLSRMHPGEQLTVRSDDPAAAQDFELFCADARHLLLASQAQKNGEPISAKNPLTLLIQKAET